MRLKFYRWLMKFANMRYYKLLTKKIKKDKNVEDCVQRVIDYLLSPK